MEHRKKLNNKLKLFIHILYIQRVYTHFNGCASFGTPSIWSGALRSHHVVSRPRLVQYSQDSVEPYQAPSPLAANRIKLMKPFCPAPSRGPLPLPPLSLLNQSFNLNSYPLNQFGSENHLAVSQLSFKIPLTFINQLCFSPCAATPLRCGAALTELQIEKHPGLLQGA